MSLYRRFRDAVICIALLAIPFFFLNANLKNPSRVNAIDRFILQVSAPIQYVSSKLARGISGIWEEYIYLVNVSRDNDLLRRQNARLRRDADKLQRHARENRRLRALLQLREQLGGELLSAQIIAKEVSPFFRVIRIRVDRGERDRIRPGMPVIGPDGLVGQIRRTWSRYSDVLLTIDAHSAVDVVVQRTGSRGILRGTGDSRRYLCQIQYLLRTDEVKVGDSVYTSGFGHRFPPSLLVGKVTKVIKRDYGLYQEAEVTPSVNFSRLEEVLVLLSGAKEQLLEEELSPSER